MPLNIVLIYGSVRQNRKGIRMAKWMQRKCEERNFNVTLLDPKEQNLGLMDKMYKVYKEGEAPQQLVKIHNILEEADGFILVSGEYNHSIPPPLSNMMDYFQQEYYFKPAAISSYSAGTFGGVRAAVQLRSYLGELGMPTISSILPVGKVQDTFEEDGTLLNDSYEKRVKKFLDEFEWYANVLKEARKNGTPF